MPSAPATISSQSKKKLRAFSFNGQVESYNDDKENGLHFQTAHGKGEPLKLSPRRSQPNVSSKQEPAPPSTPASRIPLADLIGNIEDAWKYPLPSATPLDHVGWSKASGTQNSSSFQSTQRGKKRARSSSPGSSQPDKRSQHSASKEPSDLENVQKSLRTPQNDPAADLWNNYASGLKTSNVKPSLFRLSPSSPKTPSTTNSKDSALRRTASCGVEWPMSKSKRRRTDATESFDRARGIFAAAKREILAPDLPKQSRVSMLVEKIQESLSKKQNEPGEEPSSSSPLPERDRNYIDLSPIPEALEQDQARPRSRNADSNKTPTRVVGHDTRMDSGSSDYGDDEIDISLVETFERVSTQQSTSVERQPISKFRPSATNDKELARKTEDALQPVDALRQPRGWPAIVGEENNCDGPSEIVSDDELLDDDETFTTELHNLVDKVDSQRKGDMEPPNTSRQATESTGILPSAAAQPHDEFDDDDELWQNLDETMLMPTASEVQSGSQPWVENRAIKRYLIVDIVDSHYSNSQGRKRPEKMLSVKDEKTKMLRIILLRQSWYQSRCTKGSFVHLIGNFDRQGQCIVDDANNMLILHPDHLISATVVADSFTCVRRAILQDRVKATSAAEKPQVYGHIIHAVFGEALTLNAFSSHQLRAIIEKLLPNYLESLYEINVQIPEAIDYLMGKMPELQAWASVFVSSKPIPDAVIRDRNGSTTWLAINKLLAVEEHIWSPMYGLKGNIDATVQVAMKTPTEDEPQTLTIPFELKTGKKDSNEAHRAQTALYTLLMTDRYDINVTSGVLYYLETSKTFRIEGVRNEIRHMIIQRNELACYVHEKLDLPPMIRKSHLCKNCYAQTSCFAYHKLVEDGNGETSGLGDLFKQSVNHLKPEHQQFFRKWDKLLTLEERDTMKFRRELWTMLSHERESLGRCFSNVVIEPGSATEDSQSSKINRFQYAFAKQKPTPGFSFTESQLTTGEPIVISDEKGHFALANGYVTNVRPTRITVAVDRKLHDRRRAANFHAVNNQSFAAVTELTADGTPFVPQPSDPAKPTLYRIDKDEFNNGMATARNNLIRMMEKDLFRARDLRALLIDNLPPSFKPASSAYVLSGPASQQDLNVDQRRAIDKVMSAKDYALVLGMPGTGKTTTIAHIIRALVAQGKSVLLTSYTHTAVDNILLKIKDDGIPVLRLGSVARIHPDVKKFADLGGIPKTGLADLEQSYVRSMVVATTCLGINEKIFNARIFDYCIVDEASQITLPVCLGPIRMARAFVLVGDHYQLPPLVQNREAAEGGLDVSLFRLLSERQPGAVVGLEHQYRMAEDVMLLSNELVYGGRLKCGTQAVARRVLDVPNLEAGLAVHHHHRSASSGWSATGTASGAVCAPFDSACWLRRAMEPRSRCLFLDTDALRQPGWEVVSGGGNRITNPAEAVLLAQLVTVMIRCGVPARSIGVITFYRSQLALLRQEVKALAGSGASAELEMHTADRFQGRDKEVILLSCVRNNEGANVGDLLKDWRRVNVAVTRAKSKLVLVGSLKTLAGSRNETLEGLVRIVRRMGWVVELPGTALEGHAFEYVASGAMTQRGGLGAVREGPGVAGDLRNGASPSSRVVLGETSANAVSTGRQPGHGQTGGKDLFRRPNKVARGKATSGVWEEPDHSSPDWCGLSQDLGVF